MGQHTCPSAAKARAPRAGGEAWLSLVASPASQASLDHLLQWICPLTLCSLYLRFIRGGRPV